MAAVNPFGVGVTGGDVIRRLHLRLLTVDPYRGRADGMQRQGVDVRSEPVQFLGNMGWNTTGSASGGESVCDPFRVVMRDW